MKHLKFQLYLLFFCSNTFCVFAQEPLGLNPPSIHWKQISIETGRIIYPEGFDSLAQREAGIMSFERKNDASILQSQNTKKVSVILQNQSTLPAGFSTPAPWRNEYYLTPPQNLFLGPVPWMDALTIHEYRHTQQFDAGLRGFSIPYRILMGQTGWLFNSLITQPLWFREGDAVTSETIYTKGGRGRLPSFNMEYRAQLLSGKRYSYEKAHWTSLKDFVPNPYRLGYYMTTKARRDFGNEVWKNVLDDAFNRKGFFYPFSRSMQKFTGYGSKQFYNQTIGDLEKTFRATDLQLQLTASKNIVSRQSDVYTSYRFPHYTSDGKIVALKNSFNEIYTYYSIDSLGNEKKLFSPGIYTTDHFTSVVEGNLMVWCESSFDERWINQDYSIIKLFDFASGKETKLTSRSKYFSPAPSRDGKKIVCICYNEMSKCNIVILDSQTGDVIKEIANPGNIFFTQPRWMEDDKNIIAISVTKNGNALIMVNAETGNSKTILDYTDVNISRPFPNGDFIFFSAGFENGIDNIYAIHLTTNQVFKITSVRFGAYEPCVSADGKKLLYSEYTADGYFIKEMMLDRNKFQLMNPAVPTDLKFHLPILKSEGKDLSLITFDSSYTSKKYHALTDGLFNVYGWFPIPNIPEYGVEFYTKNIMSTLQGTVGFLYNTNENNFHSYIKLSYAALYPVLNLQYEYGKMRKGKNIDATTLQVNNLEWTENTVSTGLSLPFRLTQGTHYSNLNISALYEYYDVMQTDTVADVLSTDHFFFNGLKTTLNFSRLRERARRDVQPRWGETLNVSFQKAIDSNPLKFVAVSQLFFPGIIKTQSFNLQLSYKQEEVINTYRYIDNFNYPRGYTPTPFETIYGFAVNYEFPVWYPDLAAGPVAFFQRIRLNLFYDYSIGKVLSNSTILSSTGAELFADFRMFRLFQVSAGMRYSYTFNNNFERNTPFQFLVTRFEFAN